MRNITSLRNDSASQKEKLSFNLMNPERRIFNKTVLWIVYHTIESNAGITLNQLKWLLNSEYMLNADVVERAVASLTSKSMFDCVSRWQPPSDGNTSSSNRPIHLRTRTNPSFNRWLHQAKSKNPELSIFVPPKFVARNKTEQAPDAPQPKQ